MSVKIKPLEWKVRVEDGQIVTHADPEGLRYSYYINQLNNQFALAFVEENGQFEEDQIYSTLELAKLAAENHYSKLIRSFIIA